MSDRDELLRAADAALQSGRPGTASEIARALLRANVRDIRAYTILGLSRLGLGNLQAAIDALRQAVSLEPSVAELHHLLGTALEAASHDAEAIKEFSRAVRLKPEEPVFRYALGQLQLARGNAEAAAANLEHAVARQPEEAGPRLALAQALAALDREEEAEGHLRTAIARDDGAAPAYAMLGYRLQTQGKFTEAGEMFRAAITRDPRLAVAYQGIAQGKCFAEEDRPLLDQMRRQAGDVEGRDLMILSYAIAKAEEDLGDLRSAALSYREANGLAFQVNLGGRPFARDTYRHVIEETVRLHEHPPVSYEPAEGPRPIFIVGMLRSGTTLVDQILARHPAVVAMGENKFWRGTGHRALAANEANELRSEYLERVSSIAGDKAFVIDKTPQNFQHLGAILTALPSARVIHIRRDPADNCLSIFTTAYEKSPEFAHEPDSIGFAYRMYERLMAHWRAVLPADRFFEIEYEKLVDDPEPVIRRTLQFCGLSWSDACLRPENGDRPVKTPSMWQVRQPIYTTSIGRAERFAPWLGEFVSLPPISAGSVRRTA